MKSRKGAGGAEETRVRRTFEYAETLEIPHIEQRFGWKDSKSEIEDGR